MAAANVSRNAQLDEQTTPEQQLDDLRQTCESNSSQLFDNDDVPFKGQDYTTFDLNISRQETETASFLKPSCGRVSIANDDKDYNQSLEAALMELDSFQNEAASVRGIVNQETIVSQPPPGMNASENDQQKPPSAITSSSTQEVIIFEPPKQTTQVTVAPLNIANQSACDSIENFAYEQPLQVFPVSNTCQQSEKINDAWETKEHLPLPAPLNHTTNVSNEMNCLDAKINPSVNSLDTVLDGILNEISDDDQDDDVYEKYTTNQEITSQSISDRVAQVKQLLSTIRFPYIEAPGEAEAQCAFLETNGLVEGIITDDSDVFLFGGKTVYRGIFGNNPAIRVYRYEFIEKQLGLNLNQLQLLPLFLGSDYCMGVKGVGIVNVMEILAVFQDFAALERLKQWAITADEFLDDFEGAYSNIDDKEREFKLKHSSYKNQWEISDDFPNERVVLAYQKPNIDPSLEPITWGKPNIEEVRSFCAEMQIDQDEMEKFIKALTTERLRPTQITDYMPIASKFGQINSRRLKTAIAQIHDKIEGDTQKTEGDIL